MNLEQIGWDSHAANAFQSFKDKFSVGRVLVVHKNQCQLITADGELAAAISPKLHKNLAESTGSSRYFMSDVARFPSVGDWALFKYRQQDGQALVQGVLPRRTVVSRNDPGKATEEQVMAANVDQVFLVMALNMDYNLRRVERYLAILLVSNIKPVIILNKSDLCSNVENRIDELSRVAIDIPILAMSALNKTGLSQLNPYLSTNETSIFIGSSGAGKTTIINEILGEERFAVQEISDYRDRGRHTTSARQMIFLDTGAIIIDTPGVRRINLWSELDSVGDAFRDIDELAVQCRFSTCTHRSEPGCAVLMAIEDGKLEQKRLDNYYRLQDELKKVDRKAGKRRNRKARISYAKQVKNAAEHRKKIHPHNENSW